MSEIFRALAEADPLQSWWPYIISIAVGIVMTIKTAIGGQECPSNDRLTNCVVLLTDATDSVSVEIAKECARRDAKALILGCDDVENGRTVANELQSINDAVKIEVRELDMSSRESICRFSHAIKSEFHSIDILIQNTRNARGLQGVFFGPILLILQLMSLLRTSKAGRIVNIVSDKFSKAKIENLENLLLSTNESDTFATTHLALLSATKWFAKENKKSSCAVTANACFIGSNIRQLWTANGSANIFLFLYQWVFKKTPKQAAQTPIFLATDAKLNAISGELFNDCDKIASESIEKNLKVIDTLMEDTTMGLKENFGLE